jgi:hypothetical protein
VAHGYAGASSGGSKSDPNARPAHETVDTKENGVLPYKINPKTVLKRP